MKKLLVVGVLVFTMAIGAFAVYADSDEVNEFSFGRGFGMGRGIGFSKGVELTEEEREELIEERKEFFENRENFTEEEMQEWINEREEYREERIEKALEDGTMTEEEAAEWREHFDEMDEFHEESGFFGGGCHGGRRGNGKGYGMMGGNRF